MNKIILVALLLALFHAGAALAAVNVNSADASALAGLDGIGPVKAQAIVDYREDNGDFSSLAGLTDVTGVGDKTVEGLRDQATVGGDG